MVNYMSANPTYVYDGSSLRVKKCLPDCTSPTSSTVYIFSGSKVIAEYDNSTASTSPSREYIYSGGTLLAKIDSSGTKYYHQDHLSNRVVTDSTGNTLAQMGHFPYGESWYNASNDKLLFTSYERDSESSNDHAMMRSSVNRLARFSSPDPLSGTRRSPQSLNRNAYALDDPINLIDPRGMTPRMYVCGGPWDPIQISGCSPWGSGGGGGGGALIMGNDIFDAISGEPGTYLRLDMYGNLNFGFSIDLWAKTWNHIDEERSQLASMKEVAVQDHDQLALEQLAKASIPDHGWMVTVQDFGVFELTGGIIPELEAINSYRLWLAIVAQSASTSLDSYQDVLQHMMEQYEKEQEGLTGIRAPAPDPPNWSRH